MQRPPWHAACACLSIMSVTSMPPLSPIRDTSAQDRPVARQPLWRRRMPLLLAGLAGLAVLT